MSIKELLTFLSIMLLESVNYITDHVMVDGWWWCRGFCAVIAPSLAPSGSQHGSHPVAASDSGDGIMMVRWWDMTDHTQHWLGRVTSSLLPHCCCCYTFLHTFMFTLSYIIVPGHLSVWDGHRRTCPSHSLSLISITYCQNRTNRNMNK